MKKHLLAAITVFCGTLSLSAQIPTNGLVSKWTFDSHVTNEFYKDEQGTHPLANNGVAIGAPRTAFDTSTASFGNGTSSMTVNNSVFRSTSFSIATWFKITATPAYNTLASVRIQNSGAPFNSYNLNIGSSTSSKLTFFFSTTLSNDVQIQNPSATGNNVWTHAAVTCNYNATEDSTSVKMYVNNILAAQTKVKSYIIYNPSNNPLVLGSVTGAPSGNSLYGNLDNMMFYNRALTALEVGNIFNGTSTPSSGLISYWKFNQSSIQHDRQNAYTLTNSGAVPTMGKTNVDSTAAYFNGSANMSVNNAVFRPTSFSIATWFKRTGTVAYHTIANVRINTSSSPFNSYNLCFGNSTLQKLTFFFTTTSNNDLTLQDTSIINPNVWTHVAVTCDYNSTNNNTTIKLYVNGSLHAQGTYSNSIYYSPLNKPLTLGSVSGAPTGNSLDGSLDEFLFYNRALSPTEVTNIFSGITTGIHSSIQNKNSEITLYPNPTSSILNIEVKEQTQISIVNMLGEVVKTETITGASKLDVRALHAGVYFIQDSKSGKAIKFIKQ